MKKMKNILLTTLLMLGTSVIFAQDASDYRVSMTSGTVSIAEVNNVMIEAYDGNEVIIEGHDNQREDDDRARGLKLVNSKGLDDNTGFGISAEEKNNTLYLTQISSMNSDLVKIKIPRSLSVEYSSSTNHGDRVKVKGVSQELIISATYGDVILEDVTGPMAVKTIYGSIEAHLKSLNGNGGVLLESVYDFVDLSVPASTKASIEIRTPYGEIYSDMNIEVDKDGYGMKKISSKAIKGTINGGGTDLNIKSSYDNVYLRKK